MRVVGVIAEYNPFHSGHAFQLVQAKRLCNAAFAVVVMSGNFAQRGEPALINKHVRARMALSEGADLVLELPLYYATASAAYFAKGAIGLLQSTQLVTHVCFGSEIGEMPPLAQLAAYLAREDTAYQDALKAELAKGFSYPKARQNALDAIYTDVDATLLREPNNTLAVEYVKALHVLRSAIQPQTVKRLSAGHHDAAIYGSIASASAIRRAVRDGDAAAACAAMPPCSAALLREALTTDGIAALNHLSQPFHYLISRVGIVALRNTPDMTEGLENRIVALSSTHYALEDMITAAGTKRYPLTRIRRAVLHALLGITRDDFDRYEALGGPQYIRVLGFRKEAAHLLKVLKQNASLPLVTNLKYAPQHLNVNALAMLEKEIESTDVYHLAAASCRSRPKKSEYSQPLVIV